MPDAAVTSLSIIIPTCDRPSELRVCLAALEEAQVPGMECIIVDNGLAAGEDAIRELLAACTFTTRLIRIAQRAGSAAARNAGAFAASGEILLFVDDDVCVHRGSVAGVMSAFEKEADLGAVFGRYDDAPQAEGFISQFRNLLHAYTHDVSCGDVPTFWTGFGAVRADVFRQHGGFVERPHAIDDVEFGTKLSAAGVRIALRSDLQVKHLKQWTLGSMLRTDLLLRGVPWTMLIWQQRRMPDTLNLRKRQRWSIGAASATAVLPALCMAHPALPRQSVLLAPLLTFAAAIALNAGMYAYLRRQRGWGFAARCVGPHFLHLLTAGVSFCAGTALYYARSRSADSVSYGFDRSRDAALRIGLPTGDGEA